MKYDFENEIWPDSERVPYKLIQWWTFGYCRTICRRAIKGNYGKNWSYADEYQHAFHESQWEVIENCLPIEALMFRVLLLVMLGGRGDHDFSQKLYMEISGIIAVNDLSQMMLELDEVEKRDFEIDLRILGIDG